MTEPITCPCGLEKTEKSGTLICPHCDTGCQLKQCALCLTYSISVNNRVAVEHSAERAQRRRNGC